jgi:uncharacterized protein YwqG
MKKDCIEIELNQVKSKCTNSNLKKSKFWWKWYFPKNMDFPKNSKWDYLMLLAQFNFSEIPKMKNYPEAGILQFYIDWADSSLWFNDVEKLKQDNFRIIYHENIMEDFITDFSFLDKYDFSENSPFLFEWKYDEFLLEFKKKKEKITISDYRYYNLIKDNISKEISKEISEFIYDEIFDILSDEDVKHKIWWYADSAQDDARDNYFKIENIYNYELLFQIKWDDDMKLYDNGFMNFFIQEKDLKNKDFSKVLFDWTFC